MVKMMTIVMAFAMSMLSSVNVWAHSALEKNVTDVLMSDKFCIQYIYNYNPLGSAKQMQEATDKQMVDMQYVNMLLKDGNNLAVIMDLYQNNKFKTSTVSLYKDGCSYTFMTSGKKCYSETGYVLPKGTFGTKTENDMALKNFEMCFNQFFVNFLPFLPDENKTIDPVSGKEVAVNSCNVFNKETKEIIGGKEMSVIEYITPSDTKLEAIGRYYFIGDTIFNYVRYEKEKEVAIDKEWQEILGTETYQYGGSHKLTVHKFTKSVNTNLLQVPQNVKFYKTKVAMPSVMY